ncbi:MAG: branched-chain amino acid transaminase [Candidatus Altiarchaeales archaeon]|nr:branched-chain amino acid transaminase [Candidatus Altiarchaeota archaeon]MBU4341389.1 branched-chain amino acid transaminase [Candidatus Altiarchaeota archaeon]MBU4406108.1 branched-chain amino acid transaminase [Candidatus Altiarchaeota archaeon]MBU4437044.1 branched-chain amino acid transaminase [Candidatus Altiarchaeota archaeon]MCG2782875.1 branched-chain amino acid transaminase [Candidatus Altiarchaeales archaeon]
MPIKEVDKIWMNGKLVDWKDAKIHVLTHALHYGSGVFEGIRCYKTDRGPAVFRLREHMKRLENSAKIYMKEIPYSVDELCKATKDLIKANKLDACYIRPIAYRGYGEMGLNPTNAPVDVTIAVWPWGTYLGEDGLKNGIRAKISSFQRISPNILPSGAKASGQYINSILAKLEALDTGYDEAILLDSRGFVSEGPGENLFMVKDGIIYTPPEHASILAGITRDAVMKMARDMGYEVKEIDITRGMLYLADEAWFTGTAAELTPIREIDGRKIGKPGPITKKLQEKFFDTVKGKVKEYEDWLDYV